MANFLTLTFNTFEEALRRKVIYILIFLALFAGIRSAYQLLYIAKAESTGGAEMLTNLRSDFVLSLFSMMEFWGVLLAVFLGSVALSSEIEKGTIVPVLSRPVSRFSFFMAKWVGTMAFLTVFVGSGVIAGLTAALSWQLYPSMMFALGTLQIFLHVAVISALSLALSSVIHPVMAGGGTIVVVYLHGVTAGFVDHPNAALRVLGIVGRYLSPAGTPESLLESGLVKGLVDPDYALYMSVLAENAGYALAALVAGALVFQRREIRVR